MKNMPLIRAINKSKENTFLIASHELKPVWEKRMQRFFMLLCTAFFQHCRYLVHNISYNAYWSKRYFGFCNQLQMLVFLFPFSNQCSIQFVSCFLFFFQKNLSLIWFKKKAFARYISFIFFPPIWIHKCVEKYTISQIFISSLARTQKNTASSYHCTNKIWMYVMGNKTTHNFRVSQFHVTLHAHFLSIMSKLVHLAFNIQFVQSWVQITQVQRW